MVTVMVMATRKWCRARCQLRRANPMAAAAPNPTEQRAPAFVRLSV